MCASSSIWRVLTDHSAVGQLEAQWRSLEAQGGTGTPFQAYAWCYQWLTQRGRRYSPFVLVNADCTVIAPFAVTTIGGVRLLRLIGTGDSDYLDLVTSLPSGQAWDAVIDELLCRKDAWHALHLQSIRQKDDVLVALRKHLGLRTVARDYEKCPRLAVGGTWETYLDRRKKLKRESRRWAKRVQEFGAVTIEPAAAPISATLLGELIDVERESWKWELGTAALKPGGQADFVRAILQDPRMPATVWCLRVNTKLAAFAIVLEDLGGWYYYLPSFRQRCTNAGAHLLSCIVESAHARGCGFFDLLQGDHGYKSLWTDERVDVAEIVAAHTFRGRIMLRGYAARWRAAKYPLLRDLRNVLRRAGDRRSTSNVA